MSFIGPDGGTVDMGPREHSLDYQTPTLDVPPPAHGSAAWHLDEAAKHLEKADRAAVNHQDPTARLLAAIANAQVGALKQAIELDQALAELRAQLIDLARRP